MFGFDHSHVRIVCAAGERVQKFPDKLQDTWEERPICNKKLQIQNIGI